MVPELWAYDLNYWSRDFPITDLVDFQKMHFLKIWAYLQEGGGVSAKSREVE